MGIFSDTYHIDRPEFRERIIQAITNPNMQVFTEIGFYYTCIAPKSLYKYFSDKQRNADAVFHGKLWYSAACCFNDVFDCEIAIDKTAISKNIFEQLGLSNKVRPGSLEWRNISKAINDGIKQLQPELDAFRSKLGITCLCESYESLLMWAHYANNHHGMCAEYNLLDINKKLGFTPVPVIYAPDKICLRSIDFQDVGKTVSAAMIKGLTSKSPEWSYEKEWRIIREEEACGEKWDSSKHGALLDMIKPASITLGCAVTPEFEKTITDGCSEYKINLFKMEKDDLQYRLNRKQILAFDAEK